MATYNGHKNWNYWNVSLWLGNDEGLYNLARECKREVKNRTEAATMFLSRVGTDKTPDGAKYSVHNVVAAMRDL